MRFVMFDRGHGPEAGVWQTGAHEAVVPFAALGPDLAPTLADLINQGEAGLARVRAAITAQGVGDAASGAIALSGLRLLAPIARPARNIFCVGKNYVEHAKEFQNSGFDSSSAGQDVPDVPIIFTKAPSSVIGPDDGVLSALDPTHTLDYEGELAVIIGKGGRGIPKAAAMSHIWGYTIANDVTARQTQNRHRQWFLGKSPDTFCPMGPAIVTADAVPDVTALRLTTHVNGELRQNAIVADLIFDIPTLIETISAAITLEPGDIIATGTPVGVGIGYKPPRYLVAGDTVRVEITGLGILENPIL